MILPFVNVYSEFSGNVHAEFRNLNIRSACVTSKSCALPLAETSVMRVVFAAITIPNLHRRKGR
jgi:hypothetical protein